MTRIICVTACFLLADHSAPTSLAQAPATAENPVLLRIKGEVPQPLELTAADLAKLPRKTLRARDREGAESTYEGVPLVEILKAAGLKFGEALRGSALTNCLVVEASDQYRVLFALPELDPAFTDRQILLADRRDGQSMKAPCESSSPTKNATRGGSAWSPPCASFGSPPPPDLY